MKSLSKGTRLGVAFTLKRLRQEAAHTSPVVKCSTLTGLHSQRNSKSQLLLFLLLFLLQKGETEQHNGEYKVCVTVVWRPGTFAVFNFASGENYESHLKVWATQTLDFIVILHTFLHKSCRSSNLLSIVSTLVAPRAAPEITLWCCESTWNW